MSTAGGAGMHLYLIRHAERLPGRLEHHDFGLTERGKQQAAQLAEWFARHVERPELVMSSTMPRALQTAELLAAALYLPVVCEPRLREVGGCRADGVDLGDAHAPPYGFPPRTRPLDPIRLGGESWAEFGTRVHGFLCELVSNRGRTTRSVVLVCHSGVVNAIHESIVGARPFGVVETALVHTGITHWEYRPMGSIAERWRLHGHNLAYHLAPGPPPDATLVSGAPLAY